MSDTRVTGASRAGALLVMAGAALFGTIGTARVLGPSAPAASVAVVRLALAAVLLIMLSVRAGRGQLWAAWRLPAVWMAGVAQAAFNLTFFAAVTRAGVALGTLVAIVCTPILTGLLARHITRGWLAATGLAVVGLVMLLGEGVDQGVPLSGVLFALAASASYATFITAGSAMSRSGLGTTPVIAAVFTVAAVVLAPSLFVYRLDWLGTGDGVAMVLYLAIPGTVVAYSLFNRGLGQVASATASTLALTEPVVAALLGVLVLDEHLSAIGWAGACVVLLGLVVMIRLSRPRSTEALRLMEAH